MDDVLRARDVLHQLTGPGDLATVLRGAGVVLAIRIGASGLSYVAIVALARWMGAAQYGVYSYALAWSYLLCMPAGLGLHVACVRFLAAYVAAGSWGKVRGMLERTTVLTLGSGTLIALVALATAYVLRDRVPEDYRASLVIALLGVPVLAMVALGAQVGRAFGWVGIGYAPPQILQPSLLLVALFALRAAGVSLAARVVVPVAIGLSAVLVAVQAMLYAMRLAPRLRGVRAEYEQRLWLRVAVPLLLIDGFGAIITQADIIMVGSFLGPVDAAHYTVAARTAALTTFFLGSIAGLAGPKIAELHAQGRRDDLPALLAGIAPWIIVPAAATTLGLALIGPWLLQLFGPGFEVGYPAMVVVALGYLGSSVAGPTAIVLNMTGHQDASARTYAVVALGNVVMNAVLIPRLGIVGAALAGTLTGVAGSAWLYYLVRRGFRVDPTTRGTRTGTRRDA